LAALVYPIFATPRFRSLASLPPHAMNLLGSLFTSSIGKKFLMALTGLVLFGFVTGHLLGNLQFFLPPVKINAYAHTLESLGALLWVVRIFLLVCLVVHVWVAIQLTLENRAARPEAYGVEFVNRATLASRVMARTGLVVLAFVIYHLMDFTLRVQHPEWGDRTFRLQDGTMVRDVYAMMVHGFSRVGVSVFYVIAVGLLSYHLSHGIVSMVQTLGLKNEKWTSGLERFSRTYCWLYFLLNAAIPLAVLGWVPGLSGLIQR
jgi:succinate dehydrogenase / fumarate reductase cytochrome b subunit